MCCLVLLLYRSSFFFFLLFRPPPKSTLFPYTTLFRSTGTGQWGTEYDRSKDLGRVSVASRPLAGPVESLTISLVPEAAQPTSGLAELRGTLKIQWGTTEFSIGWRVEQ